MKNDFLDLLIHKQLTGDISVKDQQTLEAWVSASEGNKQEYAVLKTIWEATAIKETELLNVDMDAQLRKLMSGVKIEKTQEAPAKVVSMSPRRKSKFPWMKVAAGFILVLGAVMIIRTFGGKQERALVETTSKGEVETIDMMDGSTILMDENASVTFFPHIKSERRIELNGEAFFDVARDEAKPFIVETSNAIIRVLGTSFKVSNDLENETVVAVRHGKVEVTPKDGGKAMILTEGQRVSLQDEFSTIESFSDQTLKGFNGLLDFNEAKLTEVVNSLEHKFGKEINWDSKILAECELNGQFEGKSLEEIMDILKTVFNFENIVFEDTQVTMTGGFCK